MMATRLALLCLVTGLQAAEHAEALDVGGQVTRLLSARIWSGSAGWAVRSVSTRDDGSFDAELHSAYRWQRAWVHGTTKPWQVDAVDLPLPVPWLTPSEIRPRDVLSTLREALDMAAAILPGYEPHGYLTGLEGSQLRYGSWLSVAGRLVQRDTSQYVGSVRIGLHADGRVGYWRNESAEVPPVGELVSMDVADVAAIAAAARSLGCANIDLTIIHRENRCLIRRGQPHPTYGYQLTRTTDLHAPDEEQVSVATVLVDAHDGRAEGADVIPKLARHVRLGMLALDQQVVAYSARTEPVADRHPVWTTAAMVLFASNRAHVGAPSVQRRDSVMHAVVATAELRWDHAGWNDADGSLGDGLQYAVAPGGALLWPSDGSCEYRVATSGERIPRADMRSYGAIPDVVGDHVIWAGLADTAPGDLWLANYDKARGSFGPARWISVAKQRPLCPCLSTDGTTAFIAWPQSAPHGERNPDSAPWSVGAVDLREERRHPSVRIVSDDWTNVTRLSRVGDEPRLLVSAGDGLHLVELADGSRKALPGQPYHDPDTNEALHPVEAAVSPDGQTVAFCAKTKGDEQHESYQCLYLVKRDGTGLRRLTPRADPVIEPAWLPERNESALELNKRWWLERQEELERRRTAKP